MLEEVLPNNDHLSRRGVDSRTQAMCLLVRTSVEEETSREVLLYPHHAVHPIPLDRPADQSDGNVLCIS